MSYYNYWSHEANEARHKGHEDERYLRNSYAYDKYSDNEIDKAYFEGRREERRQEEDAERQHYAEMIERQRQYPNE